MPIIGGSGSGKTRFWLKPNLMQCHSSLVITDPKGSIVIECGKLLLREGYKIKILKRVTENEPSNMENFSQFEGRLFVQMCGIMIKLKPHLKGARLFIFDE